MTKPIRFGIVAGEKSGDILGASLISALRTKYPDCEFVGVGGPAMEALGCESLTPMDRLSVMGFVEPLGRLPELLNLKKRLVQRFMADKPVAFIGIDSPAFNLRLAANLHQLGVKTIHYVSPSVWAYHQSRIHKIKACIDLMLTLFPFETAIYKQHGIPVACVGHPLADEISFEDHKIPLREEFGIAKEGLVIVLMPGSRAGEIKRLTPTFLEASISALRRHPQLNFVIPYSGIEAKTQISSHLRAANIFESGQFKLLDNSHKAMSVADLVIMASGTATLEGLLLRRPMIICYKLAPITYAIGSRILQVPYVGLPNLLAGEKLIPEYLQNEVSAKNLRREIDSFIKNPATFDRALTIFDDIHKSLRGGASLKAAAAIANTIDA
ncbi:MAG: lipid-A-disaccharide synthase [Gammaproteobacteria bacterium]|nr:lipid-A-disaccharide synthase [Gammaproteobacteria bacterium]MDD9957755.1 lipid-A-disaccharide synthase [Gammaproteobacteria bacterium]